MKYLAVAFWILTGLGCGSPSGVAYDPAPVDPSLYDCTPTTAEGNHCIVAWKSGGIVESNCTLNCNDDLCSLSIPDGDAGSNAVAVCQWHGQ